jgi:hypothetical protein
LVTTSKTSLSEKMTVEHVHVHSGGQALKGDQDDPVDDDALGHARERPAALRVRPHWSVE